jgi:hypothetical protein
MIFTTKTKNVLPKWYTNYGSKLNEDATVVYDDDVMVRIKQYLEGNPTLMDELKTKMDAVDSGASEIIMELDPNKYKVLADDALEIKIDKTDDKNPRMLLAIMNDDVLVGNLDLSVVASYVIRSMKGWGTDEDMYGDVLAAMHKDLADRGISEAGVQRAFDILNSKAIGTKFDGYTFDEWIDGDFDGRAEICAMMLARRPIPYSFWRGIDWFGWAVDIALIALAIPTLGGSLVASGAAKAGQLTAKSASALKATKNALKASRLGKGMSKGGKIVKGMKLVKLSTKAGKALMKPIIKGWTKLSKSAKLKAFGKAYPKGAQVGWRSGAGNQFIATVSKTNAQAGKVLLTHGGKAGKAGHKAFWVSMDTFMTSATKAGVAGPTINTITKVGKTAGISTTAIAALAAHKGEQDLASDQEGPGWGDIAVATGQGFLNYDATTADPAESIAAYKTLNAEALATAIYDSMDGWTSNSDELAIAMMILCMDKTTATALLARWNKLYADTPFYDNIIAGELESDMAAIVGAYWTALTGDGPKAAAIGSYATKIKA